MSAALVVVVAFAAGFLAARLWSWLTRIAAYRRQERWPIYTPEGPR